MPKSKSLARKVSHDLEPLIDDVVTALKKGVDEAGEDAQEALETLADATTALADAARSLVEEGRKRTAPLAKSAAKEFKEHPVATAAALAVAAAAVAGVFASRRKHAD